jgi:hypothetical protein
MSDLSDVLAAGQSALAKNKQTIPTQDDSGLSSVLAAGNAAMAGKSTAGKAPIDIPTNDRQENNSSSVASTVSAADPLRDFIGGLGETIAGGALGFAGQLAGGAASYAGRFLPGGDWDRAQRWADATQKAVSTVGGKYNGPETTTGKAIQDVLAVPGEWLNKGASIAGSKVLSATGSAPLAATTDAAIQALVPLSIAKLAKGRVAESVPEEAPTVAPEAAPEITRAVPATGEPVVGGISAPEIAQAIKNFEPTQEVPATPIEDAADHVSGALSDAEQADRKAVLARVGHAQARDSAIEGNGPQTMFDYDAAKSPSPAGLAMRAQLDAETETNKNFANSIVKQTGGTVGLDQDSLWNRGSTLNDAWSKLRDWHENNVKTLYVDARARLGDTPVTLDSLSNIATDPANVSGTVQGIAFKNQLDSVMRSLGLLDKDGNALPATVNSAERLRQWMNKSWTPETSGFIKDLKSSLDDDVTSAAGQDVFERARAARTLMAQTLDNNKAISRIFDSNGTNRAVPIDKIPDAVARLPSDQLSHVVNIFNSMPEGLQPLGTAANKEIAAHFANKIADAGTPASVGGAWSNIGVSDYIANNNRRLSQVFNPDGLSMIQDLNEAGKITAMDKRYVGAAGQGENFARRGMIWALPKASAGAGAAIGGLAGAAVGAPQIGAVAGSALGTALGTTKASAMQDSAALAAVRRRIQPLSQVTK